MATQTDAELATLARKMKIPLVAIITKDRLPKRPRDGAYIINLQDSADGNGTHWVAVYIEDGQAVYIDSFGMPPPAEVQLWLYPFKPYAYSIRQVQSMETGHCGQYATYALWFMKNHPHFGSLQNRLDRFLDLWSVKTSDNLHLLQNYLRHYL